MPELDLYQSSFFLILMTIFVIGAAFMITRKLPALLVLPIMGFAIGLAAWAMDSYAPGASGHGVSLADDILGGVVQGGAGMLVNAMIAAIFGGMISFIMQKSGVAENMVKQGAELIGDNPLAVGFFSMLLVAAIFTTVGGLGAIIMVAIVVLPMLATVGTPPAVAGAILLIGLSMGGVLNPQNWALYVSALDRTPREVREYALIVFVLMAWMGLIFVVVELTRARVVAKVSQSIVWGTTGSAVAVLLLTALFFFGPGERTNNDTAEENDVAVVVENGAESPEADELADGMAEGSALEEVADEALALVDDEEAEPMGAEMARAYAMLALQAMIGLGFALIMITILADLLGRVKHWRKQVVRIKWYAYLIPAVPLVLIMVYDMAINAALLFGFVYAVLATLRPGSTSLTVQSMIQGATAVLPAVLLMIGIGILLRSILGPAGWASSVEEGAWPVIEAMAPVFDRVTALAQNGWSYVLLFGICAPLALYRGPLNTWGLGFGVATLLMASGLIPAAAIMAMLLTVGQVQSVSDPTNTHNVWIANEVRADVNALMIKTIPYVWGMVFVGLGIAALKYF